jgi:hypothetical protein
MIEAKDVDYSGWSNADLRFAQEQRQEVIKADLKRALKFTDTDALQTLLEGVQYSVEVLRKIETAQRDRR